MEELLSLIRSLAEQTEADPEEVNLITQARDFAKEEASLMEERQSSRPSVSPMEALTRLPYTYQTAETTIPVYDRKPEAVPTITERTVAMVAQAAQRSQDQGPIHMVTEPLRVAGMSATIALTEKMSQQPAIPEQPLISHNHQATPSISVKHFIPNTPDTDFLAMFREFDAKVQLPDLSFTPAGPLPTQMKLSDEEFPISSEQYAATSLQNLLSSELSSDRMPHS